MSTNRVVKAGEHYAAIASLSWIDPQCGLPNVDRGRKPGCNITRSVILSRKIYRFANYLEAWVVLGPHGKIARAGFTPMSGMYRAPSFLQTTSKRVGEVVRRVKWNDETATFVQLVGCRAVQQERLGEFVGGLAGGLSACPLHDRIGRRSAEKNPHFPPIWTELQLTINADGTYAGELGRHSWFPSVTTYLEDRERRDPQYREVANFDAANYVAFWRENGWNLALPTDPGPTEGNPWGMSRPSSIGGVSTPNPQPPVRPWPMTTAGGTQKARRPPPRARLARGY